MKGNQGLEALAALCGGAAKVDEQTCSVPAARANTAMDHTGRAIAPTAGPGHRIYPGNPTNNGGVTMPAAPQVHHAPAAAMSSDIASQQQQWAHQAMAAAAASTLASTPASAAVGAMLQAALHPQQAVSQIPSQVPPAPTPNTDTATSQHLAYMHYIQAQAAAAAHASQLAQHQALGAAQVPAPAPPASTDPNAAVALALAAQQQHAQASTVGAPQQSIPQQNIQPMAVATHLHQPHQVLPTAPSPPASIGSSGSNTMLPPAPQTATMLSRPTASISSLPPMALSPKIHAHAPAIINSPTVLPIAAAASASIISLASDSPVIPTMMQQSQLLSRRPSIEQEAIGPCAAAAAPTGDKKQLKRAANRRSAQLSRKRKKQFIEELKEENDTLRRKEQILKSIPDLIVVFDSAGKLCFVSHSVKRFLKFKTSELEASSFWDRLCDESVRLLKAAFMDALAARSKSSDTVPLGSGMWELRLVDRDGTHKLVTLNGVVHFSGEAPECVCSIRPRESVEHNLRQRGERPEKKMRVSFSTDVASVAADAVTVSTQASSAQAYTQPDRHFQANLVRDAIKPQQSVISNGSSDDVSVKLAKGDASQDVLATGAPISDNESCVSE